MQEALKRLRDFFDIADENGSRVSSDAVRTDEYGSSRVLTAVFERI